MTRSSVEAVVRFLAPLFVIAILLSPNAATADPSEGLSYAQTIENIKERQAELGERWRGQRRAVVEAEAHDELLANIETLTGYWLGTRWALGSPQTTVPQSGKVNCGTFVGRVLNDAGFHVHVKKLNRQPSQLIIKSFVGGKRVRKFSNSTMKKFLASVREMGPGFFIIGLDFHVGLLLQTEDDLRFIHASFETETVVNEPAHKAMPITTSKYKVVGKILSPGNVRSWLSGKKINVQGDW